MSIFELSTSYNDKEEFYNQNVEMCNAQYCG